MSSNSGWPQNYYVPEGAHEFLIRLFLYPMSWYYKCMATYQAYVVLGISCISGKHSTNWAIFLAYVIFSSKKNERKTVYERWKYIYSEQSRRTDFWQIWLSISAFESSLWVRQHTKTLPLTIRSKINLVHHTVFKIWYRREPSQSWIHCAAGPNKCCSLHEFFHGSCVFPHTCT